MSQYIVDFKDNLTQSEIEQYLSDNGATVVKTFNAFKNAYVVESAVEPPLSDLIEHIIHDDQHPIQLLGDVVMMDNMALLQQDTTAYTKQISTSDNKEWWKLFSLEKFDFNQPTVDLSIKGKGATIYLVDSGIKHDHVDFVDADIQDLFSITSDFNDNRGHGTALASVMVGKTCGITNATVKNVKLFDPQTPTKQSDMLAAFDAIFNDFAASNTTKLGIVNCSWAIARNSYIENKIQILIDEGIFVVCAAGNSGTIIENVTPAAMENTIVLGAYNSDFQPCDFSNYTGSSAISVTAGQTNGGKLSGWAPGQDIWVATIDGNFGNASGTSLSAAIHSAILASQLSDYVIEGEYSNGFITSSSQKNRYFGRNGILDLSAAQYSSSPNIISSFPLKTYNVFWKDVTEETSKKIISQEQNQRIILKTDMFFMKYILDPSKVKSAEIMSPLPEGLILNNRGEIRGITAPIADPNYEIKNSIINVTKVDDSVTSLNLQFIIKTMDSIDSSVITTDDPEIVYQLMAQIQCSTSPSPPYSTKTDSCADYDNSCYYAYLQCCDQFCTYTVYGECSTYSEGKNLDGCQCIQNGYCV